MARSSHYSKHKLLTLAAIIGTLAIVVVTVRFFTGRHQFKEFCAKVTPGTPMERLDEISEGLGYNLIEGIDGPTFISDRRNYYVPHAMFCTIEVDDIRARRKAIVVSTKFDETSTLNGL